MLNWLLKRTGTPVVTETAGSDVRWFSCRQRMPKRRIVLATSVYVGVIVGLSVASSVTQDSVGPALYLLTAFLTLPTGLLIYPALFVNLFLAGAIANVFGLGSTAEQVVIEVGVTVVFSIAALVNSVLLRLMWQSVRGLRQSSTKPSDQK